MMDASRPDRILQDWADVAHAARRPATAPKPVGVRVASGMSIAGAGVVLAAVLLVAMWVGRPGSNGGIGAIGSPGATETPTATVTETPVPTPAPVATPTAVPSATPTALPSAAQGPRPCEASNVVARITSAWGGAAGNRIADVELTNTGTQACTLRALERPQLVDGTGSVLIDGSAPKSSTVVIIAPGDVVTTQVSDTNYCGPAPSPPVTVAFVLSAGDRIVATPFSPTDATVPPCNGPASPSSISMHPWAR
ncbi:MAG: DUF4232 domain-containing protein [Chloroflexota bacterium]